MMFSTEKCSGHSRTGSPEETEIFAGGGEGMGKEGVPSDEVASAVAAVSDEIGDILKDELGDADRVDRIGAELADLSAELGLLAGLADGEPQQDFPSLFEIAMGHRGSASGSSSSSTSSSSGAQRARRNARPLRPNRRRPIGKQGKEMSRRRAALGRRVVTLRLPRIEILSDASDVGADSDSDDQWTEFDESGSSGSSSGKEVVPIPDVDCSHFRQKEQEAMAEAEVPPMGQFLLPLLSAESAPQEHFLIRHEDILQLLASAEESARAEMPVCEDTAPVDQADMVSSAELFSYEDPTVSAEEEAALLQYVAEAERQANASPVELKPVEEWLMGVFHSWCEISALMYTMCGTSMSTETETEEWLYLGRFPCHCRLCLCLADSDAALNALVTRVNTALLKEEETRVDTAVMVRTLMSQRGATVDPAQIQITDRGAELIHEQLCRVAEQSELARQVIETTCLCRPLHTPLDVEHAVERYFRIMENFKAASTVTFKVELVQPDGSQSPALARASRRLARYLAKYQYCATKARLRDCAARTSEQEVLAWAGYKHRCECLTPRTLCAQQRKELLRLSFFGLMQVVNELNKSESQADGEKPSNDVQLETTGRELQQGDGTGAKPPDATDLPLEKAEAGKEIDSHPTAELDDDDSDLGSGTASLGLSTSSSLDSASELLLAAAAAVESGGSESESLPGELCRTVRHLMRSIASIERLMDRVLRHCDDWPSSPNTQNETRKKVDQGLSEVDRKLMAMYRRLPEVHRKQLHVYRKQKKLSTVCMQLVGGAAPAPPPPGSPPPSVVPNQTCRALCPEYHLQRFKEVRRKVMHMRDQQLYYHRLRMWLEEQLKQERDSITPESNVTLVEDLARSKRRNSSPKSNRVGAGNKRKLKSVSPSISKPHRILQMLKHKAPAGTAQLLADDKLSEFKDDDLKSEVEPPEAFPLEKDYISDTETVVGEKEADLCKEMKECLAKFANFALNTPDVDLQVEYEMQANPDKYPDSVSPPLQEMSPTTTEPMPVYTPKPNQRLLSVNKLLSRSNVDKFSSDKVDFQAPTLLPEVLNITPLNARRTPMLVEDVIEEKSIEKLAEVVDQNSDVIVDTGKDPNIYKYVTFGLEIKKAMEECQNIINSYNSIKEKTDEHKVEDKDGPLSLEQICEVMMNLDKNSAEFLDKIDSDDALDINTANTKLAELVENMPQILANMPEIATKLSEFANASFELPEFASIMSSLPDVNNEAQLTPETLKQIRELKLNKTRDSVKVTKNTTKRKSNRKIKNNIDNNDIMGTMTFEFDCKDISDLLKDEKELQALMKNKSNNKEDFKDLLFSISAQVVINKVFEYLKQNKSPELAKCLEEEKDLFSLPKNSINSEMFSRASTLFDNSVKDALSMDDLRDLVKSRFNSWKHYVASKFKSIPIELLENEIEAMLDKFYSYIQDLAGKQCNNESDKIIDKIDEMRLKNHDIDEDSEVCPNSKESLKQITKLLSTSAGNTFDLIIMKLSKMSKDNQKSSVRSLKFKYMDVIKRCADSQQLASWILLDPEIAANVILEMTGLPPRRSENNVEVASMNIDKKREYFLERLREMNTMYMETLPKNALSGDEWLVMLYRLEEQENKLKDALAKACTPKTVQTQTQNNVSETHEAEILAGKGLSKIISKANARAVKKPEAKVKNEEKSPENEELTQTEVKDNKVDDKRCRNDAVLAKCEAILTSKGEKSLLDSFYTIKSYITQGLPVPETYKKHVISICSSIDAKLLDEVIEDTKKTDKKEENADKKTPKCCQDFDENDSGNSSPNCCNKDKNPVSVIGPPELLAKYSAQALRKAKQTLNAVAFRKNMMRNGQTKSESDACDTPKTDCKWTNDCMCDTCKGSDVTGSVCLGDIVKQCYDMEAKSKANLEEKKKEVKPTAKPVVKQAKPPPKPCENTSHQQHVCKGHTGPCASEGVNGDQPCTCCYCTVFGHAPPITTPVPRNFNETRERLRSILNKKKQKCKTAAATNGDQEPIQEKKAPLLQEEQAKPKPQLPAAAAKPPALPKTLPPNFTTAQTQAKAVQAKPVQAQVKPVPTQAKTSPAQAKVAQAQAKPSPAQAKIAQAQAKLIQAQAKPVLNLSQEFLDTQQKQLAERMARMAVTDHTDAIKMKTLQRTTPMQVNVSPAPAPAPAPAAAPQEGKVNAQAMDQIRQQQIKQQQLQAAQAQAQLQAQAQAQKKPEPIYDLPTTETKDQSIQRQMQQHKQIQQQVQQQIQQHFQQQQDERGRGQRRMSICSRDSSVFSTSSSGGSCWRGSHAEDPRDLDALLQYIEGPSRHVDRGKKRAKKQRQKAKKMEARLLDERAALVVELTALRRTAAAVRGAHASARRRVDEHRAALKQCQPQGKKGKKQKQNPAQQAKAQMVAEQLGELTTLMNQTAKELQEAESQVSVYARRLHDCENQLQQARAQLGNESDDRQRQQLDTQLLQERQLQIQQHQREQHQKELQRQMLLEQQKQRQQMLEQHKLNEALMKAANAGGMIRLQRTPGDVVTVSVPTREHLNFSDMPVLSTFNITEEQQQKQQTDKKQTWEQALHHMNQLVKKEKKKQKETPPPPKPEPKPKEQPREPSLTEQPLSKKQRKALAKKQAEEEEARRKQQEAKSKSKTEQKKQEPVKAETNKKSDKKEAKKEQATAKKEDKKDNKKQEKTEKKGKENKQEKNAQAQQPAKQTKQQEPQPAATSKKSKKKQPVKPHVINITPDTTIELVDKKGQCVQTLAESPAACSIMEQLSCGVQVADLKLPPGITLTRVQPYEKKEAPSIKSVPIWNCAGLSAAPTPVARPPPVINADPAMMMFTTAQVPAPLHQTEPPKTIIIPEPPAQPTGKSKKAKKKAKKAAAAAESQQPTAQNSNKQDGTKMVTLRNPMFHPNLPPVQVSPVPQQNKKPESIRIPDPIPMPPNACQATITPTSNGMYTIRNPLMSMMHQQSLMGMRPQSPQMNQMNPMFGQPNYNQYMNPNPYNPVQNMQQQQQQAYVLDSSRTSPKNVEMKTEYQNPSRLMNLASFTQKNDEGYSLFKTNEDNQQRGFLTPESYYLDSNFTNPSPKPTVSPNPIGTRPNNESHRPFESNDSSLFANNPVQRPEPIGTPLKRTEEERNDFIGGLYTPFGQEDRNVFRNALFDKSDLGANVGNAGDIGPNHLSNGDTLPYFQRLRVGSKLNNEVTIHHVTESKFYKGQEPVQQPTDAAPPLTDDTLFSYGGKSWTHAPTGEVIKSSGSSSLQESVCESGGGSPLEDDAGFGAVGTNPHRHHTDGHSLFMPERPLSELSPGGGSLEALQRYEQLYMQKHRLHHLNTN